MPDTPYASPGFMIANFLSGYMRSAQDASAQRQERANSLMDMAIKYGDAADNQKDPSLAADFTRRAKETMDEANKMLTQKVGLWHLLSQVVGKGKESKITPQLFEGLKPQGQRAMNLSVGGGEIGPEQDQTPGLASMLQGAQQEPPTYQQPGIMDPGAALMPQDESMTPAPPAAMPSPGMGLPMSEQATTTIPMPPPLPTAIRPGPTMRIPGWGMAGADEREGIIRPEERTGIGVERIRLAPDVVEYRQDGTLVSRNAYDKIVGRMAERRSDMAMRAHERTAERREKLQDEILMLGVRDKAKADSARATAESYKQNWMASGEPWSAANEDIFNQIAFDAKPVDRKATIVTSHVIDPETGNKYLVRRYSDPVTGTVTDREVVPREPVPHNELGMQVQALMQAKGMTWDQAVVEYGKIKNQDEALQRRLRSIQAVSAELEQESKKREIALKDRRERGTLTRNEFVKEAHTEAARLAANSTVDPEERVDYIAKIMLDRFGVSWDEYVRTLGGDPSRIADEAAEAYRRRNSGVGAIPGAPPARTPLSPQTLRQ